MLRANIAQLVEQQFRKLQVKGSSPFIGSIFEVWLSLVERCVRDAEVAGSNPVTSTISSIHKGFDFMNTRFFILIWFYVRSRFSPAPFAMPFSARLNTWSRHLFVYRRRYSVGGILRVSPHTRQSDNKLRFSAFGFYLCPLFRKHQYGR